MKKSVFVIALAFGVSSAFAQDLTSKKGEPILPEANDWAISFNADPIFKYVGNAFNGNTSNDQPGVDFLNGYFAIVGKKFIDEKSAYRVIARLGFNSTTNKGMIAQVGATAPVFPNAPAMVEDKQKVNSTFIALGAGKEWRRGKTRLQGFYGADAMILISTAKTKYEYGNAASAINFPSASNTFNFGSNLDVANEERTTETKAGFGFGIGVRGFIGAEYFILPKIAIGAEYGWGIAFNVQGKGKESVESIGGTTPAPGITETETGGNSSFGFDNDLSQGSASLKVTFHF